MTTSTAPRSPLLLIESSGTTADGLDPIRQEAAAAGFDVVQANTLAEGSNCLEEDLFACVVLDFGSEDEEDVAIIETIANRSPEIALIVLGRDDENLGVSMIEAGASDYLPRNSLGGQQLCRSIQHAIVRKRSESSLAEAQKIARLGSWEVRIATGAVSWSQELYRMFGFPRDETPSYEALLNRTHPEDRAATLQAHRVVMDDFKPFVIEHRVLLLDDSVRWVRAQGRVELDATGQPVRLIGTTQDITEQKDAEDALQHQALHHPLTGLPNQLLLLDRIGRALNRLARLPSTLAVIHFDMDRFELINDSLGHEAGDQLLAAMGSLLAQLIRPEDTLAHVGSDEFVVLCEGLSGPAEALSVANRICTSASQPLAWDRGELVVTLSAGIALTTSGQVSPDSLLKDADAAMHRSKRDGRARSTVFAERMRTSASGRLETEISLRQSIIDGELRVHYQPIVTLTDGAVQGHEALVRWAHPSRGLLAPDQFISIAEESGLIVALGAWVLRESCQQAKRFQERDPSWSHLTMSVNLSGGQLNQPDLVELVGSALQDADLKPGDLQLEMTESILMDDASTTITILERLKGLGLRLGIDDFGTGYSSLSYLRRFPVDVLKIDKSFVSGLGKDPQDSAIVAAVVSLADTLGLTTIAEGVETKLQRDCLVGLGCSLAQGYLFARPVAAREREAALDQLIPAMS